MGLRYMLGKVDASWAIDEAETGEDAVEMAVEYHVTSRCVPSVSLAAACRW